MLFHCRAIADILTKLSQQCFLFIIVVVMVYSQVSVYRTIGPLVSYFCSKSKLRVPIGYNAVKQM